MKTRVLILLLSVSQAVGAFAQSAAGPPRREDIVDVIYEFDVAPNGKPHNFKVSRCERATDRSDASGLLSATEKAKGASIIAFHHYPTRPDQVGKKRYEFLLFDTRSRRFSWGYRPKT
jgi:hypothetical protein